MYRTLQPTTAQKSVQYTGNGLQYESGVCVCVCVCVGGGGANPAMLYSPFPIHYNLVPDSSRNTVYVHSTKAGSGHVNFKTEKFPTAHMNDEQSVKSTRPKERERENLTIDQNKEVEDGWGGVGGRGKISL